MDWYFNRRYQLGYVFESVLVDSSIIEPEKAAREAQKIAKNARNPVNVMVHLMFSANAMFRRMVSIEMTSFRSRPLLMNDEALAELRDRIFSSSNLQFWHAEILLAKRLSEVFKGALYFQFNDTYNSIGYCWFASGEIQSYEFSRWEGSDGHIASSSLDDLSEDAILSRAVHHFGMYNGDCRVEDFSRIPG